jgi:hypothetical protein
MNRPTHDQGTLTSAHIPLPSREILNCKPAAGLEPTRKPSKAGKHVLCPKEGDIPRVSRETTGRELLKRVDPARLAAVEERLAQIPPKYRNGYLRAVAGVASPRAATRAFCLECLGWISNDVANCTSFACPQFSYRPFQGREA